MTTAITPQACLDTGVNYTAISGATPMSLANDGKTIWAWLLLDDLPAALGVEA